MFSNLDVIVRRVSVSQYTHISAKSTTNSIYQRKITKSSSQVICVIL